MNADQPQRELSPESADLIEELDRQLRDLDEPKKPNTKGNNKLSICQLNSGYRAREEEVINDADGNCDISCITPVVNHQCESMKNYGISSHAKDFILNCKKYMNCNTLCYQMALVSYLHEGLVREKVSVDNVGVNNQKLAGIMLAKCPKQTSKPTSTHPPSLTSSTILNQQTMTNHYDPTNILLLYLLLLSNLSLSPPRPTTPSRPPMRQIPSVTSRTDDVQGACVIRMYISVTYSARK